MIRIERKLRITRVATFAFVHGAWHGGWAWDPCAPSWRRAATASSRRICRARTSTPGVEEYAAVVRDALDGDEDAIVVGHSLGGLTIPLVPARRLVFLSAYVPEPGRALLERGADAWGPGFAESTRAGRARALVLARPRRRGARPPVPAGGGRRSRRSCAGRRASRRRIRARSRRCRTSSGRSSSAPSDYAIPPEFQRRIAREELGVEPIELETRALADARRCPGSSRPFWTRSPDGAVTAPGRRRGSRRRDAARCSRGSVVRARRRR